MSSTDYQLCVVTAATGGHVALLPFFLFSVRRWYPSIPIYVITFRDDVDAVKEFSSLREDVVVLETDKSPNLPEDEYSQAAALKLRLWSLVPRHHTHSVYIDVDAVLTGRLLDAILPGLKRGRLCLALDSYIGYKEAIEFEFAVLGKAWAPSFECGERSYCNTGMIGSNRGHATLFDGVLETWALFFELTKRSPALWDQNVFNYCLDVGTRGFGWSDVDILQHSFNALKEYDLAIDLDVGELTCELEPALLLHFNGGSPIMKYARRAKACHLLSSEHL